MDRQGKCTGSEKVALLPWSANPDQLQTQQHNITTVSQKLVGTRIPKKAFRSGSGSAATIGICW
jgi:hypothetical protein